MAERMVVVAVKVTPQTKRMLEKALIELGYAHSKGRILRNAVEQVVEQLVDEANVLRGQRGQAVWDRFIADRW